jgi:hypothetical protein
VPLAAGCLSCGLAALVFVLLAEKGRLFKRHHVASAAGAADGAAAEGFEIG